MYQLDLDILYFLNQTFASTPLDAAMSILTNVRYWIPVYVIAAVFLVWRYKWYGVRLVIGVAIVAGVADLVTNLYIKQSIERLRPCALDNAGLPIVSWIRLPDGARGGFGMPSSHAVNNFAAAAFFATLFPSKRIASILFSIAALVALTRPYLGLHYPSDILVGAIAGGVIGFIAAKGFLLIDRKYFLKSESKS